MVLTHPKAIVIAHSHPTYRRLIDTISGIIFPGVMHNGEHNTLGRHLNYAIEAEIQKQHRELARESITSGTALDLYIKTCQEFTKLNLAFQMVALHEVKEQHTSGRFSRPRVVSSHDLDNELTLTRSIRLLLTT